MELAKQMILTSVNAPKFKTESDPEKKKHKWESRKSELVAEIRDILLKEKRPMQTPVDSEEEEEELPQKRPKEEKKSKSLAPAVQKKDKRSQSHSAGKEHQRCQGNRSNERYTTRRDHLTTNQAKASRRMRACLEALVIF